MKKLSFPLLVLAAFTCECAVGPNYRRPKIDTPVTYRGAPQPQSGDQSFGDQKWAEVFQDPQLQELIRTALKQNYDLQIAAARGLQAQALLGITRADQLPTVGAGAFARNIRLYCETIATVESTKRTLTVSQVHHSVA